MTGPATLAAMRVQPVVDAAGQAAVDPRPDVVAVRRRRRPRLQRGVAGALPHIAVRLVEITPTVASPSWASEAHPHP